MSLLQRTLLYTRLINAPTSVVGHDDQHNYHAIQEGLATDGNEWVSLHRNHTAPRPTDSPATTTALSEVSMRGQYRAWARFMTLDMPARAAQ